MADNLTDGAEARALNFLTGNAGATAPTLPLSMRLMTANGSDSAAGTEVTNAGGSTYAAQTVTLAAASGTTQTTNSADVVFNNMPAATVVGIEIWDAAGTPFRWWYGAATASKTVALGDTIRVLAGQLVLTMQ
jgi:hypothetical protein